MKLQSTLAVSLLFMLLQTSVHAQKNMKSTDSLFADFDLFTLKGIQSIPAGNPDSIQHVIKYTRSASGQPQALEVISYKYKETKSRKATIRITPPGTFIGFKTLKTDGWEKVLIFGQKYYYHDTILIRNDTVFFKSLHEDGISLQVILPLKNDTLRIREISKSYRGPDLDSRYDDWISMAHYKEWFKQNDWDRADTYTLLRKGDHYEIIQVNTDRDHINEYDYKSQQKKYQQLGLSLFWLTIENLPGWW
jgi:hypothetical protein